MNRRRDVSLLLADCSDGELAALAIGGNQAAFGEIMRRHRNAIYRLAYGHVGDPEAALDLVQEAFVAAFDALDRYDQGRPLRTRSEERRVGKECVSTCRSRWSRYQ